MRPVVQMIGLSRLVICAWLIIYVPTISLVATYLPSLPSLPYSADRPASLQYTCHEHFYSLANHVSNFEDNTAALTEEDDKPKKRGVGQPSVVGVLCPLPNRPFLPNSISESRAKHLRFLQFATLEGPRASPSIISF